MEKDTPNKKTEDKLGGKVQNLRLQRVKIPNM